MSWVVQLTGLIRPATFVVLAAFICLFGWVPAANATCGDHLSLPILHGPADSPVTSHSESPLSGIPCPCHGPNCHQDTPGAPDHDQATTSPNQDIVLTEAPSPSLAMPWKVHHRMMSEVAMSVFDERMDRPPRHS